MIFRRPNGSKNVTHMKEIGIQLHEAGLNGKFLELIFRKISSNNVQK